MFIFFLENMALIIALMYLALKSREYLLVKRVVAMKSQLINGLFMGFLAFSIMYSPLPYEGMRLDLREAPLFFIAFVGGWRSGIIAAILPAIFRISIGGPLVLEGIFHSIVLAVLAGSLFHEKNAYAPPLTVINIKRMLTGLIVYEVVKSLWLLWQTPATWAITSALFFFSLVAVLAMGLMLNDAHRNIISRTELEFQSSRDPMTQLPNIRYFKQQVQLLVSRQTPMSIVMFDVDHFKQYNDTHGHPKGDEVLRTLAGLLRESLGENNYIARYGGEEFVFCLTGISDVTEAEMLVERLRQKVERTFFEGEASQPGGRLTISLGISSSSGKKSLDQLIDEADAALYVSKKQGRNLVTVYTQETAASLQEKTN